MPDSKNSKSQKRSKSQSKSGGRRRKHTMRKLRRGKKSRKVMRGGGMMDQDAFNKWLPSLSDEVRSKLYIAFNVQQYDESPSDLFKKMAGNGASSINTNLAATKTNDADIQQMLRNYQ